MQYKETEEMDSIEEKAVVKVDADGGVVACAKGLDVKECGFKGGKVCGACGAMAVSSKASGEPLEKPNEMYSDEMNDVLKSEWKRTRRSVASSSERRTTVPTSRRRCPPTSPNFLCVTLTSKRR